MHAQIKTICESLKKTPLGLTAVRLTAGQRTPMGKLLHIMYYRTDVVDAATSANLQILGYPHNGGEHSCHVVGQRGEVVAFLELLKETVLKFHLDAEEVRVANQLSFVSQDVLSMK